MRSTACSASVRFANRAFLRQTLSLVRTSHSIHRPRLAADSRSPPKRQGIKRLALARIAATGVMSLKPECEN